jgi:hypothetical protein
MFENRDRDGDGKLQGDEIPPPMRERIGMLDENGDGALDKSELEKGMSRLRGGAANREERRGGDGVTPKRPPRGDNPPKDRKKDPDKNKA